MNDTFKPYSSKNLSHEYGIYLNLFYNYVNKFQVQPNVWEIVVSIKKTSFKKLEKLGAKQTFFCNLEKLNNGKREVENIEVLYEYEDAMLHFYQKKNLLDKLEYALDDDDEEDDVEENASKDELMLYRCKILYQNTKTLEKIRKTLDFYTEEKKKKNVYLLCSYDGMLTLQRFDVKLPSKEMDMELNYGKEGAEKFEKIIENLSLNKNGLILFSGEPGTGKSTFIKYLTTKTTRKIIYLSSLAAEQLTNPDFLSFIMRHRNAILLLEDAEKALRSRNEQDNGAISNILNITDGILGDCLNIMVIATFNIEREKIDSALVRKGRLVLEHHFEALPPEDCNKIFKNLGSSKTTDVPMTLAEIYNQEDNGHVEEEKRKIGF